MVEGGGAEREDGLGEGRVGEVRGAQSGGESEADGARESVVDDGSEPSWGCAEDGAESVDALV